MTLSTGKKNVSPMYDNPAGPGDYNIMGTIGSKSVLSSNMRKSPGFSFSNKTKLPYYKGWEVEFLGADSPSVSKYTPKHNFTNPNTLVMEMPKQERFYKGAKANSFYGLLLIIFLASM